MGRKSAIISVIWMKMVYKRTIEGRVDGLEDWGRSLERKIAVLCFWKPLTVLYVHI